MWIHYSDWYPDKKLKLLKRIQEAGRALIRMTPMFFIKVKLKPGYPAICITGSTDPSANTIKRLKNFQDSALENIKNWARSPMRGK